MKYEQNAKGNTRASTASSTQTRTTNTGAHAGSGGQSRTVIILARAVFHCTIRDVKQPEVLLHGIRTLSENGISTAQIKLDRKGARKASETVGRRLGDESAMHDTHDLKRVSTHARTYRCGRLQASRDSCLLHSGRLRCLLHALQKECTGLRE